MLDEPEVWEPLVAPDGKYASWLSTTTGRPSVHVASINGENYQEIASEALAGHPFRCYCWMYDGKGIWLLHVPNDDFDQTELWGVSLTGNVISKTRLGTWSQLFGATKKGVLICDWDRTNADSGNLFLIDPTTQERRQLTDANWLTPPQVAVNTNEHIAYTAPSTKNNRTNDLEGATVIQDLGGSRTVLEEDIQPITWGGDRLLLVNHSREDGIGVWSPNGDIDWLGPGTPFGFLSDGQILAIRDGAPLLLPSEEPLDWTHESVVDGGTNGGSAVFVTKETESYPSRVIGWTREKTATLAAPEYSIPPADLPEPEAVSYVDSENEDRDAWLLLPDECPAPCLIHLYGFVPGRGDFDRKFGRPFQYLRNQGYAIFQPAHGGSRFSDRRHADYAAAATWAAQQEWSNGQIVAIGHSSGGYDVLQQAAIHATHWDAGIVWNGIVDLRKYYDIMVKSQHHIDRQLGDDNLDRLEELSPVTATDSIGIPLLVLSSEQDWLRNQTCEFAAGATNSNTSIVYEEIKDTGHWTRDVEKKVIIWKKIDSFLNKL